MMELFDGLTPAVTVRIISAAAFGVALTLTLAMLRGLGFRRSASVPATLAAFAVPYAWIGSTSPIDYAAGLFGSALILWCLFRPDQTTKRGYSWRATLSAGLAYMLHQETALLIPAVGLAVARHRAYRGHAQVNFFSVAMALGMTVAVSLGGLHGDSARIGHFAKRALAGANNFDMSTLLGWAVELPMGFGVILFGLYQMLFAARRVDARRAPLWIVPWCLAALAPVVAGSPDFAPIAPYLIPAGALGLADWLNRRGTRAREARWGLALVLIQVIATTAVSATR